MYTRARTGITTFIIVLLFFCFIYVVLYASTKFAYVMFYESMVEDTIRIYLEKES